MISNFIESEVKVTSIAIEQGGHSNKWNFMRKNEYIEHAVDVMVIPNVLNVKKEVRGEFWT